MTITATDGAQTSTTDFALVVDNVAPTATIGSDGPVLTNTPATVSFTSPADPSTDDLAAGLHYAFACDGGSLASATYATSGTTPSTQCTYVAAGPHTVTARVIDKDGGFTEYQSTVTVRLPPTITWVSTTPAPNGNGVERRPGHRDLGVHDSVDAVHGDGRALQRRRGPVGDRHLRQRVRRGGHRDRHADLASTSTRPRRSSAPTVSPNPVVLNGSASADPGATDAVSGVDSAGCDPIATDTAGSFTVNCTATNLAGNTASATVSYDVGYAVCAPKPEGGHGHGGAHGDSSHGSKEAPRRQGRFEQGRRVRAHDPGPDLPLRRQRRERLVAVNHGDRRRPQPDRHAERLRDTRTPATFPPRRPATGST